MQAFGLVVMVHQDLQFMHILLDLVKTMVLHQGIQLQKNLVAQFIH